VIFLLVSFAVLRGGAETGDTRSQVFYLEVFLHGPIMLTTFSLPP